MSTSIDTTRLDAQSRLLDEWVEVRRQINRLEAHAADLLAERVALMEEDVAEQPLHRDAIWRSMVCEFSAVARIAKGSTEHAFIEAHQLTSGDFPALHASLADGAITAAHVREILRASSPVTLAIAAGTLPPETLELYEVATLVFAESEAPARTRAHAREVAAALAGQTVTERHRQAREERAVTVRSVGDGLALLEVVLPDHLAVAIHDRLTQMARHQKGHSDDRLPTLPVDEDALDSEADAAIFGDSDTFTRDPFEDDIDAYWAHVDAMIAAGPQIIQVPVDERTLDQIRADLLTDLLLSAAPSEVHGSGLAGITGRVQVTVRASTLTGADDHLAQLDGHGELLPEVARALAGANNGWTRLFLDATGMVTETDTYTPTEPMRRFLRARDQHCRFPGCRMPVHRCETDHTRDFAFGGPTSVDNLAHLCKTHHALKHPDIPDDHRWRVRQLPNWELEWTSPTGRVLTDTPPRRVMFVPSSAGDGADAPF